MQIFTKGPQRWAERCISDEEAARFRRARAEAGVGVAGSHDSYLINLATSDPELLAKSVRAFRAEMDRCDRLGLDFLVTHPGNATAGNREAGLRQNAELIAEALDERPGVVRVLIETTAGAGSALGYRFEEIAAMIDRVPPEHRGRLGVCLDTAHVFAAGYDLRGDYEGVQRCAFPGINSLDPWTSCSIGFHPPNGSPRNNATPSTGYSEGKPCLRSHRGIGPV